MSKGNKQKAQGTTEERRQRMLLEAEGFKVVRLAEEGIHDKGDLRVYIGGWTLVIESKDAGALNIHEVVQKAERKALGDLSHAVVWWKRKKRKEGNQRRTQVGKPIIAMSEDVFTHLLHLARIGARMTGQ